MIIEEIKVWNQKGKTESRLDVETDEGILSVSLLKAWFETLKMKIQIKINKIGAENHQQINKNVTGSRWNNFKSIQSDSQDMRRQINSKKQVKIPSARRIITENDSIVNNHKLQSKRQQKNSLKSSQMGNESDIANIANLLRQHQNNFFFGFQQQRTSINQINSVNILKTEEKILKQLQQNSLFKDKNQGLQVITSSNRLKLEDKVPSKEQNQIKEQQNIHIQNNLIEEIYYLTISVKQIKLKKKNRILSYEGLKKLNLYLTDKNNNNDIDDYNNGEEVNKINNSKYYFLTRQMVDIVFGEQTTESKANEIVQRFALANIPIDINNLYKFQTQHRQGLVIQLLNINNNQSQPTTKNTKKTEEQSQVTLFKGILPIQELLKVIEDYKHKKSNSKKKTVVIYSGKQINGKVIVEVKVSAQRLEQESSGNLKFIKYSAIKSVFKIKNLFQKKGRYGQNLTPKIMSLSYSLITNPQKVIQVIPYITENEQYEFSLPQPILEYQLILKSLKIEQQLDQSHNFTKSIFQNQSRFTKNQQFTQKLEQNDQECVIPLQNLYFKKKVREQYPMLNSQNGRFVFKIFADLQILDNQNNQSYQFQS